MTVAILDYGSGNLNSALKAFERAARTLDHPPAIVVTDEPAVVRTAERVVLPGVGAFADCMAGLQGVPGLCEALTEAVRRDAKPFLGICVGMQLLATRGLEHRETPGLGWIAGEVAAVAPADAALKVPHMGWNTIEALRPHPLLGGITTGTDGLHAYFVHSYALTPADRGDVVATVDYGGPLSAIVARDNVAGTQFHPEKSQTLGLALIANFLRWMP